LRLLSVAVAALALSACQLVLGDFEIGAVAEEGEIGNACRPEEYRCTGAELEVCADDRQGFVAVRSCDAANLCSVSTGSCRSCIPGELECRGQTVVQCAADSSWVPSTECAADTRCEIAADGTGECVPHLCAEGALACDGPRLLQCNRDGLFEQTQLCATIELCEAARQQTISAESPRARCAAPECEAGGFSCDGAVLRRCSSAQNAWDVVTTCASPELCNPSAGDCSACVPGEMTCAGASLIRCSDAGAFETVRTCTSSRACVDDGEGCKTVECDTPGAFRCASGNGLEVCSPGGAWELVEVCVTSRLCSASEGRCQEPTCREGELRCVGNEQQTCSADRSRFETKARCAAGTTCDPLLGCVPGACTEAQVRCNGIYLERCVSGAFQRDRRCATPELCDATAQLCRPPVCGGRSDRFRCDGMTLQECDDGRTTWRNVSQQCITGELCDAGYDGLGPPHCDQCVPGAYSCDGTSLLRCAADGLSAPVIAECETGCDADAGRCL
jgi:hypothetical protein